MINTDVNKQTRIVDCTAKVFGEKNNPRIKNNASEDGNILKNLNIAFLFFKVR